MIFNSDGDSRGRSSRPRALRARNGVVVRSELMLSLALLPLSSCDCDLQSLRGIGGAVAGVVCDEQSGARAAARRVWFTPDAPVGERLAVEVKSTATDADGAFFIDDVPPGTGTLAIELADGSRRQVLEVVAGTTTFFRDVACRGQGSADVGDIAGRICNRHTGDLVRDADVSVPLADGTVLTSTTDADGAFLVAGVPIGEQLVVVSAPGFERTFLVAVAAGETAMLDVGDDCNRSTAANGLVSGELCDPGSADAARPLAGATVSTIDSLGDTYSDLSDVEGRFLLGPMAPGSIDIAVQRAPDVDFAFAAMAVAGIEITANAQQQCAAPLDPPGSVSGRVCTPDGASWLADARVWVELVDGSRIETTSDGDGQWRLDGVPPGDHVVHMQHGSFSAEVAVTVASASVVHIPEDACAIASDLKIAVVDGIWDDVYSVLINVGVDPSNIDRFDGDWAAVLVGDYAVLAGYDIVLVNCGAWAGPFLASPLYAANLAQYVQEGGSLYVSDEAYDVVERAFPAMIDFYGDDLVPAAADRGQVTASVTATITDASLAASMGQASIELHYPFGAWAVMTEVVPAVRVYIRGDATVTDAAGATATLSDVPHTVGFAVGEGRVIYTSFHQEPGLNLAAQRVLQLLVFEL
jgi:hypothetical protein